jgi:hypothetical protein
MNFDHVEGVHIIAVSKDSKRKLILSMAGIEVTSLSLILHDFALNVVTM